MTKNQSDVAMQVMNLIVPEELQTLDVKNFITECIEMAQLYAKKNHDYGNSFNQGMEAIGLPYGVGRLYDKMNRIVTLIKVKPEVDESIEDTIKDLACYGVMTSAYLAEKRGEHIIDVDFEECKPILKAQLEQ